jgi:serine protease Do
MNDEMEQNKIAEETGSLIEHDMSEVQPEQTQPEQIQPEQTQSEQIQLENNRQLLPLPEVRMKKTSSRGKRFFKKSIAFVCLAALFGVIAGASFQGIMALKDNKPADSAVEMKPLGEFEDYNDNNSVGTSQSGSVVSTNTNVTATDVSSVVENAMPSIVAINSTATMKDMDFFGREYESEVSGSGSGIIIGENDGEILIVTNNHVVADATAVEIEFVDETKVLATIKGTEPSSDLAVLAVNIEDIEKETQDIIRIATLGDSEKIKTGELAIAIGNALGYGQSVTVGYISALDREMDIEDVSLNLIQTDAAINPGNSGGALFNARGEIIGINSVKYSDTTVEGIGYAIPISEAIPIINELMNREELKVEEMGYLGIVGKNVEESYANAFGMPVGIYVSQVDSDSAAEEAGLLKGDIIVGINGKKLETMQALSSTLSYTRGGTKVTINLKVLEDGVYIDKDVEVTLGYRDEAVD